MFQQDGAMVSFVKKVDVNNALGQIINAVDNRNYSACALLLKEGKLGSKGFLVGSAIEHIAGFALKSNAAHQRVQVTILKLINDMNDSIINFQEKTIQLDERRRAFLEKINQEAEKDKAYIHKLQEQFINEENDEKRTRISIALGQLSNYHANVNELKKSICQSLGADKEFYEECIQASSSISMGLQITLQEVGQQNSENLSNMLTHARSFFSNFLAKEKTEEELFDARNSQSEFKMASNYYSMFKRYYRSPEMKGLPDTIKFKEEAINGYSQLIKDGKLATCDKEKVENRIKKLEEPEKYFGMKP